MSVENAKYFTEGNCNFLDEKLWKLHTSDELFKEIRMIVTISVYGDASG